MNLEELKNDRSFDYKYLYKKVFPFVKPYMFRALLGILIAIPVGLLDGVTPLAIKYYVDNVIPSQNNLLANFIAIGVIIFAVVQGVLRYLNGYLNDWSGRKITNDIKTSLFEKLLKFEPSFYDKNSSGIVYNRFCCDVDGASSSLITNLKVIISMAFSSMGLIAILLYNSWQLALVAVLVLGSSLIPIRFVRKKIKDVSHKSMTISSGIVTHFHEVYNGNKIINSYNLHKNRAKKFDGHIVDSFNLAMSLTKTINWLSPIMYAIAAVGIAIVLRFGTHLIYTNVLTVGSLVSFLAALILLYKPIKTMGNTFTMMQTSFVAMARVMELFELEPNIKDRENSTKLTTIQDSIRFEDVHFSYDGIKPILKGINFNVKIGQSLALVGNSGGGKTTIANLMPRFYEATKGSIKIDGKDINDIVLEDLRNNIAVVFQDNFLFGGSIRDNILLGKLNATEEEIAKAVADAHLDEFISTIPNGINTDIGERGVLLSGGQRQRIAIARAMIKNAPIVILDEATSALDNKSEAIVQKALDKLMENRTVFVIAHRLSTIKNADKIAVINDGKLAEIGTHDDLMTIENGEYKKLYEIQFRKKDASIIN